jgi:hypothetical protein
MFSSVKFSLHLGTLIMYPREEKECRVYPPMTFLLLPKIKEVFKGRHFDDIDDIRSNTTASLKVIKQNQFQNCFEIVD